MRLDSSNIVECFRHGFLQLFIYTFFIMFFILFSTFLFF